MMKTTNRKRFWLIAAVCVALVFALLGSSMLITGGTARASGAPEPVGGNYYTPDYESKDEALADGDALNEEVCGEGFTLLKNEDDALPLGEKAKISVFGKSSANMLYGMVSNYVNVRGRMTTLRESLVGAGFEVNPSLLSFYANNALSGSGRGGTPSNGQYPSGYNTGETPIAHYTDELEQSYSEYNDAAIAVFSRASGEGWDMPRRMTYNGSSYTSWGDSHTVPGARSATDHYLQLDKNESDLLKYLGDRFDKVIVILNTAGSFECGFLDDPNHYGYHENIKAALWVGYPGKTGLMALGKILSGEINPSAKTADTWQRDFKADPTWQNFADNTTYRGNKYTNLNGSSNCNYVYYKEGIYLGYRYYETRGLTEGNDPYTGALQCGTTTTQWDSWYDAHVVYPFGYGLSYTTFKQEILSQSPAAGTALTQNGTVSLTVRVTNTGKRVGKETVQLFYAPPYFKGQIEKAAVVLGAFEKTKALEPGEFEDVTLEIKVRDMASYDDFDANRNGFKGYELDPGTYTISIMENAHNAIDSRDYTIESGIRYETDEVTGNKVENRFDFVSEGITQYLSRDDFEGTFPTRVSGIAASSEIVAKVNEWISSDPPDEGQPYYTDVMPVTGDDTGGIMLKDMIGLAYDDERWDDFLDQFSVNTMRELVGYGNYKSGIDKPSLGLKAVVNGGQPSGWASWYGGMEGSLYAFHSSDTVLASTRNKELAYRKGLSLGNEALFGNGGVKSRLPGWYAPAVNTHRSPFSGRNADYFSEDGMLAGVLGAEIVKGTKEKGVISFLKHFALNDQETNRVGLLTWANEQCMREIYFKPFEICVKEGKTTGIMSALNRFGPVWAGGCYQLLTQVLRDEWGFRGTVVTDSFIGNYSEANQMIRAGGDLVLGNSLPNYALSSATTVAALRKATHNICYSHANSMAMNEGYSTAPPIIDSYSGAMLKVGIADVKYEADLGTARLSRDLYGPDADDSLIRYTLKEGDTVPDGLSLSESGVLSGVPTEETNSAMFTVLATYENYTREAIFILSIVSSNGSIIYQSGETKLGIATIGEQFNASVATAEIYKSDATPGEIEAFPPVTYALKSANYLPEGLTLLPDGTIEGTPTKECRDYRFTVVASAMGFKNRELTWSVSVFNKLAFSGNTLAMGKYGESYLDRVTLAESDKQVNYRLKEGSVLPDGLQLTKQGYITGTPTKVVTDYKFTVVAEADFASAQEADYVITIGISYGGLVLPDGKEGEYYDSTIAVAQGVGRITYSLKDGGALPDGLSLENGNLTGTPKKAGVYELTFVAVADGMIGDEVTVTLYVANADVKKGGCNGSLETSFAGITILVTVLAAFGIGIAIKRKRDNQK